MEKPLSFIELIQHSADQYGDKPAFVIRHRIKRIITTYRDLPVLLSKVERFFSRNQIKSGDKVLIWGMNSPAYAVVLTSCWAFNRTAVPIDYRMSADMIQRIVDQTKPTAVFVSKYLDYQQFSKQQIKVFFLEDLFACLKTVKAPSDRTQTWAKSAYSKSTNLAEIVYTSGTTGTPKGVMLSQGALITNLSQVIRHIPDLSNGRIISILPLSHVFEQVIGLLLPLHCGATIFYVNRLNSYRLLQAFKDYQPTHQIFVPQLLKVIWDKVEEKAKQHGRFEKLQTALSVAPYLPRFIRRIVFREIHAMLGGQLQVIASGGAPLDKYIAQRWQLIGCQVLEGYGATEVAAAATLNSFRYPKIGTVGKPITQVTIHLDEAGEIYIQTPAMSQGYFNQPELTKQAFTNKGYRTGDIGFFDTDGHLIIKGRDVFKIVLPNGEKVFAEDVEQKAKEDRRIKDICVVPLNRPNGDEIHAYILLASDVKAKQLASIMVDLNHRLEAKQNVLSYELWKQDDFPRTSTLKIDRKFLFAQANAKKHARLTPPEVRISYINTIMDVLVHVTKKPKQMIKDNQLLSQDLGLDSLGRTELVACAEEYLGLLIDESRITHKTTVKDFKDMSQEKFEAGEVFVPTWQFTGFGQFLHKLVSKLLIFPLHNYFIRITYPQGKLPKITTPGLIIFNHPGIADVVCINRTLAKQGIHRLISLTHSEFWNTKPAMSRTFELIGGSVPLYKTGHKFMKVMQTVSDLVDQNFNVLLAPQGTIQRSEKFDPFLVGVGYIAKELNLPITMIYIHGYRELWPAKADAIATTKTNDLLPTTKGEVKVFVKPVSDRDWSAMSVEQITKTLEREYRQFAEDMGGQWT